MFWLFCLFKAGAHSNLPVLPSDCWGYKYASPCLSLNIFFFLNCQPIKSFAGREHPQNNSSWWDVRGRFLLSVMPSQHFTHPVFGFGHSISVPKQSNDVITQEESFPIVAVWLDLSQFKIFWITLLNPIWLYEMHPVKISTMHTFCLAATKSIFGTHMEFWKKLTFEPKLNVWLTLLLLDLLW